MKQFKKDIVKQLEHFRYTKGVREAFCDCMEFEALRLAITCEAFTNFNGRFDRWSQILNSYEGKEQTHFLATCRNIQNLLSGLVINYGDYLGELYMEIEAGNKHAGQFFTPYDISRLIAKITLGETLPEKKIFTLNEPACGSGGMIIAVLEELDRLGFNYADKALVVANDIDRNCVNMAYLQLSYAGVPAVVKHQDTLTQKTYGAFITPAFSLQYAKFKRAYDSLSGSEM